MAEYFLMQMLYSSASSVRPVSDICFSIGCSSTFLTTLLPIFNSYSYTLIPSLVKKNCRVPAVSELFRVSGYTGGLYIALRKYEKFK